MADIVLSESQKLAINTTGKNILVSAAAGSGKTFVLVRRVLKMLMEDHISIDSLLIVTFSNAAANEMRSRIGKAIREEIAKNPYDYNLQKQAILLNRANISTIDSFCGNIVRNNFFKVDIDPGYRIISDGDEIRKIRNEAIDILFNKKYEENDPDFIRLIDKYCREYNDQPLVDIMMKIYEEAINSPDIPGWLNLCRDNYDIKKYGSFFKTPFGSMLKKIIYDKVKDISKILYKLTGFEEYSFLSHKLNFAVSFCNEFATFELENINMENIYLPKKKPEYLLCTAEFYTLYLEIYDKIAEVIELIPDCDRMERILSEQFPYIKTLVDLIFEFMDIYKNIKTEMKAAEFNDIQHYALEILIDKDGNPTETAKLLRKQYHEIIIDEYQDSNNLQEAIFSSISRGNNMFMVGDIKQSIYKFRQANPDLFKYKYNTFPKLKKSVLIQLSDNYRSKSCVIDFCNNVFKPIMTDDFGEVDYTDEVALKSKDPNPEVYYNTEIHILEGIGDLPDDLAGVTNTDYEANYIAEQVRGILESNPDVSPNDIAILARTKKGTFYPLINALAVRGIAAQAENDNSFTQTFEIQTLIALFKILDNPLDNIPVITILHSAMYSVTNTELANIKLAGDDKYFFKCVKAYIEKNDDKLSQKLQKFVDDIARYRHYASNNTITRTLMMLYEDTGFYTYMNLLPNSKQRQANLNLLLEISKNFEDYYTGGVNGFISYLENKEKTGEASLQESKNAVKLITMHSSKGLEYPIVILGFTGSNLLHRKNYPIIHSKYGFALKYAPNEYTMTDTPLGDILKNLQKKEELSEALRLLYVALTRAKSKLIITGVIAKKKGLDEYRNLIVSNPKSYALENRNYLDWILGSITYQKFNNVNKFYVVYDSFLLEHDKLADNDSAEMKEKLTSIDTSKNYTELTDKIKEELTYVYHNQKGLEIPTRTSISEIKRFISKTDIESDHIFEEKEIEFPNPDFLSDEPKYTGANRGTVYHTILEHMDFDRVKSMNDIKTAIQAMVISKVLTQEEAQLVNIYKLNEFIKSDLYSRIISSDAYYKEMHFILPKKPYEVYGEKYKTAEQDVILRGIIDLFFIENDEIVIVDYKSDYVHNHNINELAEKYKVQLDWYAEALEKATGKRVKEKIIYSLYEEKQLVL